MALKNASVDLIADPDWVQSPAEIWFELRLEPHGWAELAFGIVNGSQAVAQRTTLALSDMFDPFPELIEFARRGVEDEMPHRFEVDSEGPTSILSLRIDAASGQAIFAVHDAQEPAIHFAAIVDSRQIGSALLTCIANALHDEGNADNWQSWGDLDQPRIAWKERALSLASALAGSGA